MNKHTPRNRATSGARNRQLANARARRRRAAKALPSKAQR